MTVGYRYIDQAFDVNCFPKFTAYAIGLEMRFGYGLIQNTE